MMRLDAMLKLMVEKNASDLFITAGLAPSAKIHGEIVPISKEPLKPEETRDLIISIVPEYLKVPFIETSEANFAISRPGIGRFRASAFQQRNNYGMVLRKIETVIPTLEELHLPKILEEFSVIKRGLVLFVGATGTGKSSSLAAMIGHRNRHGKGHIITIEDPIEFVHNHNQCIITQREVGIDTASYEVALKNTLRQAPDVILIGEIRSRETMEHAITFAETGHLCLATLHANNANQALDRIIAFFSEDRRDQLLLDLSLNLRAIIAQQLIPSIDRESRWPAVEILINTPLVADYIRKGDLHLIKDVMKKSRELGMITFDQALFEMYKQGTITKEDALKHADSANELRLAIKLDKDAGTGTTLSGDVGLLDDSIENMRRR